MAKSDRTGKRKTRSEFKRRIPVLGYYIIVTDTEETESNYIRGLKESLPKELQGRIAIKISKAKSTLKLVETCKEYADNQPQYCEPWIIFDRDEVKDFDEIIKEAEKAKICVGWSNPCLEIWFEAYFGAMHYYKDSVSCCKTFADTFAKKTNQKYQKSDDKIYDKLAKYGDEKKAIQIAEQHLEQHKLNANTKPSEMCPCTTVHILVSEIRGKVNNHRT